MNTSNTNTTATIGEESCNAISGGGQGADVTREPWWEEVGRLVDAFESELAAVAVVKTGAKTTH